MKRNHLKKILVIIFSVLFLYIITFSKIFLIEYGNHHCNNPHCHICIELSQAENLIKTIGFKENNTRLRIFFVFLFVAAIILEEKYFVATTLISRKVELLN